MSFIFRSLAGLALAIPCLGWGQVLPDSDSMNPQLNWMRSLRPDLELSPRTKSLERTAPQTDPNTLDTKPTAVQSDASLSAKDLQPKKWAILLSDKTLYRTLRRWSQDAQYQLLWQIDRDYPIEAEVMFEAPLREAMSQVMAGTALTDYPLQAIFNPQTRVLRVVRHLEEDRR